MSLLDALLLDPYRDPREIWIVPARSDGQRGDGSQGNPYNAAPIPYPPVTITRLTRVGGLATAETLGDHRFASEDLVTISGIKIELATQHDVYYLGTFEIQVTGPRSFTYQMLGVPPSAAASPLDEEVGIQCWREREQFDVIMRAVPEKAVIHLGVGVFDTKGSMGVIAGGWTAKHGQRILGAGMALTTIRLVGASAPFTGDEQHAISFGSVSADGFEVSDLTVDCNVEDQLNPLVACSAISLAAGGRHVRIRRVRAINFGSRGPIGTLGPPDNAYRENFPMFIGVPTSDTPENLVAQRKDTHNCVFEDCTVERRSPNGLWGSSLLLIGGGEHAGIHYYARGCAIRNCLVNDEFVYGPVVAVQSIEYDSDTNTATVTTKWPHGHTAPGNLAIRGVVMNGSTENPFNGVFAIEIGSVGTNTLAFKPFPGVPTSPAPTLTGDIYIGGGVSSHGTGVLKQSIQHVENLIYRLTTHNPHNLTENNRVRVSGVSLKVTAAESRSYNGSFKVTEILSDRDLEFELLGNPEHGLDQIDYDNPIQIHGPSNVITIAGGTGAVAEGNRIYHCGTGGPWHDFFSTLDSTSRNNYYHDVKAGPFENLGGAPVLPPDPAPVPPYAVGTLSHQNLIATFALGAAHGVSVGDGVHVRDASPDQFNGLFSVKSITPTSFTYELTADPGVSQASGVPKFVRLWQTRRLVMENNIIELGFLAYPYLFGQPSAVWIAGTAIAPVYRHQRLVVRGNIIRHTDNLFDPSGAPFAVALGSIGRGIVESNVINLFSIYPAPIIYNSSGALTFFNNRTIAGNLEQGYENAIKQRAPDLAGSVADALALCL